MRRIKFAGRGFQAIAVAVVVFLLGAGLAFADNVVDDVESSASSRTITAGGSTIVKYWIVENNSAGSPSGCDASDGSSVTVTPNLPAGVTATPGSLTFSACGNATTNTQSISYSSSTPDTYSITVSAADTTGSYNTNPAAFTLIVNAPAAQCSDGQDNDGDTKTDYPNDPGCSSATDNSESPDPVTNTQPQVSVTGVAAQEYTQTQAANLNIGCSVTDAEDTNESASPQISNPPKDGLGSHTVTCSYTDTAAGGGLSDSDEVTYTVVSDPDTTPPVITKVITGTQGANDWYTSNVEVKWTVTDAQSAVTIDSGCGTQNFTNETAGVTSSCEASSGGGTSSDSVDLKIDKTGPSAQLQVKSGTLGSNGWYRSDVVVETVGNDSISNPTSCSADQSLTVDTAGQEFNGSCTNDAGLTTNAAPLSVKRDTMAPDVIRNAAADSCSQPGDNGWCRGTQTAGFTASDALSGLAGGSPKNFTQSTSTEGSNVQIASGSISDLAGNSNPGINAGGFKIDSSAPTINVTGFTDGAVYYTGGALPTPGCSLAQDQAGLSGVASQTNSPVIKSGDDDRNANGVGLVKYTCEATDVAGNTGSDSKTFEVQYGPAAGSPILQPINSDNTSVFSRGKSVPVKFQLAGDEPNGFSVAGWSIQKQSIACTAFDSGDAIVEAVSSNPASLRYDSSADQYIQNTDFKSATAGSCWRVRALLDNGQTSLWSGVFKMQK